MFNRIIYGPRASRRLEQTGGIVVLFELYVDYLLEKGQDFIVVDTNSKNYKSKLAYFLSVYKFLIKSRDCSVVEFHVTSRDILSLLIPFQIIASNSSKIVVRKFAGNFNEWFQNRTLIVKKLVLYYLSKVDLLFFETKYLICFFRELNIYSHWWPNVRKFDKTFDISKRKFFKGRLLFLSQVKRSKGITDAILCVKGLPNNYTLDIYGPLIDKDLLNLLDSSERVSYNGVVNQMEVHKIMSNHDLLLFPSSHSGEGYPGVVIEAKSVGLPTVCFNHGGLSEIVDDGNEGFILNMGDVPGMIKCIKGINDASYRDLSIQSFNSFKRFDADVIHEKLTKKILALEKYH